ncbi:MAG: hypothetical protein KTR15_15310 [Phycisphaeraceae bacterium]|nr:hypothetical protein [Phycisphaeraceae bacterium]
MESDCCHTDEATPDPFELGTASKLGEAFALGALDSVLAQMAVLDMSGRIVAVNESWRSFARENDATDPSFFIGRNYINICEDSSQDGAATAREMIQGIRDVASGELPYYEIEYPCHSPTEDRWFLAHVNRFVDPAQPYVIVTHTNITSRKLAEQLAWDNGEQLARSNDELAAINHKLSEKNTEMDEFIYMASHDLQAPLLTLASYGNILRSELGEAVSESAGSALGCMQDAAKSMKNILDDLMQLSKIGRVEMNCQRISLHACVEHAMEALAYQIKQSGAAIECGELPDIAGDEKLLTRLYQNLIGNALKFIPPDRTPHIQLSAQQDESHWVLSVKDNGIGIPADQADRVFAAFKRLHSKQQYEGTGIGLAICKKIIDRHQGRIWVRSTVGESTTFSFTLSKAA